MATAKSKILGKLVQPIDDTKTGILARGLLHHFFKDLPSTDAERITPILGSFINYFRKLKEVINGSNTSKIPDNNIINFTNIDDLTTLVVLIWLDSIHDGYNIQTNNKKTLDLVSCLNGTNKNTIFFKPISLFPQDVLASVISHIQRTQSTFLNSLVSEKKIRYENGVYIAKAGEFEKYIKLTPELFGSLQGTDMKIIGTGGDVLTSSTSIRLNVCIDQSTDGRIPDCLLRNSLVQQRDKLQIVNTITMGGLMDPGRFFLKQTLGYDGGLNGLLNIEKPEIQAKLAIHNTTFNFQYNGRRLFDVSVELSSPISTSRNRPEDARFFKLILKNDSTSKILDPGATAAEGGMSKLMGDFYQVLLVNAYNKKRQANSSNKSYYVFASGDGVTCGMNRFISRIMGTPYIAFIDPAVRTSVNNKTCTASPLRFYCPTSLGIQTAGVNQNQSTVTKNTNNDNNVNNVNSKRSELTPLRGNLNNNTINKFNKLSSNNKLKLGTILNSIFFPNIVAKPRGKERGKPKGKPRGKRTGQLTQASNAKKNRMKLISDLKERIIQLSKRMAANRGGRSPMNATAANRGGRSPMNATAANNGGRVRMSVTPKSSRSLANRTRNNQRKLRAYIRKKEEERAGRA